MVNITFMDSCIPLQKLVMLSFPDLQPNTNFDLYALKTNICKIVGSKIELRVLAAELVEATSKPLAREDDEGLEDVSDECLNTASDEPAWACQKTVCLFFTLQPLAENNPQQEALIFDTPLFPLR